MKFSIIIPVYNSEQYLKECLDSVVSQTFNDFEAICINDGSSDTSLNILEEYSRLDARIIVKSKANDGVSAARNDALDMASGDYLLFLDSDDTLESDALSILDTETRNGEYDIVAFDFKRMNDSDGITMPSVGLWNAEYLTGWEYFNSCAPLYAPGTFGCVCGRTYSRKVYEQARFDTGIHYHEDLLFAVSACQTASRVKVISNSLYCYRTGRAGSAMSATNLIRFTDMAKVANVLSKRYITEACIEKNVIYRMASSYYRNSLLWCPRSFRRQVREEINWPYFKIVSTVSFKASMSYMLFRWFPGLSVYVIKKVKGGI